MKATRLKGCKWWGPGLISLLLVSMLIGAPAFGQGTQDRSRIQERPSGPSEGSQSGSNLPSWAAPSRPEVGASNTPSIGSDGAQTNAPGPPAAPSRVPVDGGVALLAAAGAGYAVRKLGDSDEDDDEPIA